MSKITKIIRFGERSRKKYILDLNELMIHGPVVVGSKPYLGLLFHNKLISVIWKDIDHEISMITHPYYRNKHAMGMLLGQLIDDVFKKRLKMVQANPLNKLSKQILIKKGFDASLENDEYLEFSL